MITLARYLNRFERRGLQKPSSGPFMPLVIRGLGGGVAGECFSPTSFRCEALSLVYSFDLGRSRAAADTSSATLSQTHAAASQKSLLFIVASVGGDLGEAERGGGQPDLREPDWTF